MQRVDATPGRRNIIHPVATDLFGLPDVPTTCEMRIVITQKQTNRRRVDRDGESRVSCRDGYL